MGGGTLNREVEKPKTVKGKNALLRQEATEMAMKLKTHWESLRFNSGHDSALSNAVIKAAELLFKMSEAMKPCLILVLLLVSACGGSPIAPARVRSRSTATFDATQLGHANLDGVDYKVGLTEVPGTCYQRDFFTYKGAPLFIVWNANDPVNQVDVAHFPYPDVHFTLSDFANGPLAADSNLWPAGCKPSRQTTTTTTTTTVPPTLKPCSVSSFVSWSHASRAEVEATGIETETVIVGIGQGPVVWYLTSWGVPNTFQFGVPLPQTRIHLTTQTLHDGGNSISVSIASPNEWLGWQIEGGCEPGPEILTNVHDRSGGGQFDWLDDDIGDWGQSVVTSVSYSDQKGNR